MSELLLVILFLLIGFSAGILIGMLGIGGGVIFIPTLYYYLPYAGVRPSIVPYFAISISLFSGAIASSFSAILHFRIKNIDHKKALMFALGSCSAAFIAALFVTSVDPLILRGIFAGVLFVIAINMFVDTHILFEPTAGTDLNVYLLPMIGFFVGALSAFTGLGGGIIFFPVLYYLFSLEPKKAIGTSSAITAATMFFASVSFFVNRYDWLYDHHLNNVFLMVAVPLGIGALIGARVGVVFVVKLRNSAVKKIFSILLILVVIKIIFDLW